jgi:hypothetical protein
LSASIFPIAPIVTRRSGEAEAALAGKVEKAERLGNRHAQDKGHEHQDQASPGSRMGIDSGVIQALVTSVS